MRRRDRDWAVIGFQCSVFRSELGGSGWGLNTFVFCGSDESLDFPDLSRSAENTQEKYWYDLD
jgi:hypothetical protein